MHALRTLTILVVFALSWLGQPCLAQETAYTEDPYLVPTSPKEPWGEFGPRAAPPEESWWPQILLWVPNRVLDLIDSFRLDVGVGPAAGAVVRASEYLQVGYRQMAPASLRVGNFGRSAPVMLERSSEFGVSPAFAASKDRAVCSAEVGAGVDLLVFGFYGGVCFDEVVDLLAGVVFLDPKGDDL